MRKVLSFPNNPVFLAKTIFLLVYAAASVLLPFLALYYTQRGLSGAQIGLLAAIPPLMTMIGTSVWGAVADATRRYKSVFLLVIIGAIGSVVLIPLAPNFLSLSLVIAGHAFCFMSLVPLLDASALEILGQRSEGYGQIRLWGSIGWGLGAPLLGPLVEQFGLNWSFYGHAALLVLGLLIAIPLPVAAKSGGSAFGQGLKRLLQDQRWYLFLLVVFVAGFGDALIRNYWFLYLQDLHTSSLLMGLSLTIGMISELVVLFYSGRLLQRFGIQRLLILSVAVQAARLLGWSFINEPYAALSLQLLNGLTFGILWLASVAYAKEIAPAGLETTAQGLLSGIYFGFSSMVGALAGGLLYEPIGTWGIYRGGAVVMVIGLVLFILASNLKVKLMARQPLKLS